MTPTDPTVTQVSTTTTDEDGNTVTTGYAPDISSTSLADPLPDEGTAGGLGAGDGSEGT